MRRLSALAAGIALFVLAACSTPASPTPSASTSLPSAAVSDSAVPSGSALPSGSSSSASPAPQGQLSFPEIDPALLKGVFEEQGFVFEEPVPSEGYPGATFSYGEQPERGTAVGIVNDEGELLEVLILFPDGLSEENSFDLGFISGVLGSTEQGSTISGDLLSLISAAEPGTYTDEYGKVRVTATLGDEEDPESILIRFNDIEAEEASE